MDLVKVKALKDLIKNAKDLENNYQTLIKSFHLEAQECKSNELVYKEDDVLTLIKAFWENGFDTGWDRGARRLN